MVAHLLYLCVGKIAIQPPSPGSDVSANERVLNPAPYVEPKIAFLEARQPSINAGMKENSRGARSACPPSWLHLEGSMFNVSFSEQHHTLRKESDAQRRNFERSSAGNVQRCLYNVLPCAGIRNVKNFVSLSCERFCYFDASGVADVFFWSEFK